MAKQIVKGKCSRWDCPSDALEMSDPLIVRELRMTAITFTCVVCGATRTEMNTPGGPAVEYGESRPEK